MTHDPEVDSVRDGAVLTRAGIGEEAGVVTPGV